MRWFIANRIRFIATAAVCRFYSVCFEMLPKRKEFYSAEYKNYLAKVISSNFWFWKQKII